MQRKLNSAYINPRSGAAKVTPTPPTVGKRQTKGDMHPFLHGRPLDDLRNAPIKSHEKVIPYHDGMSDKQLVGVANSATSGQVLEDARTLGRGSKA